MSKKVLTWFTGVFLMAALVGVGFFWGDGREASSATSQELNMDEQTATVRAIQENRPAVVNITVYRVHGSSDTDVDTGEKEGETEVERGAGTGFIISSDGYILTNKHVVETSYPEQTRYRVILSSGEKYYAQLVDTDPLNDLAVLKIHDEGLPFTELGDSGSLVVGNTVIAIGNALGRYQDTATKGIVSGLGRDFVAHDDVGEPHDLNNIIQTDADINRGNSGGPLIGLDGKVVGINVAMDRSGNSIGFAIPVNDAKPVIKSVKEHGRIIRPRLGVYYQMITPEVAADRQLPRGNGALVVKGEDKASGVQPGSPAAEAGLRVGDIIFEINAIKINDDNDLQSVIQKYRPGDRIGLKVQRGNEVFVREITLEEFE